MKLYYHPQYIYSIVHNTDSDNKASYDIFSVNLHNAKIGPYVLFCIWVSGQAWSLHCEQNIEQEKWSDLVLNPAPPGYTVYQYH